MRMTHASVHRRRLRGIELARHAPQVSHARSLARMSGVAGSSVDPAMLHRLQTTAGNRAVCSLLDPTRRAAAPLAVQRDPAAGTTARTTPMELPEAIGFIGMNPLAWKEAKAVEGVKGKAVRRVLVGLQDNAFEKSLDSALGMAQWLVSKRIDPFDRTGTFFGALKALRDAEPAARDTVAQLIEMMDGAETGGYRLTRLVMSGHSNGVELWGEQSEAGEGGGTLLLDKDLRNIVKPFPKAAAQVQAVMFSACYSVRAIVLCAEVFPNLVAAWAYAKFSPSVAQGSAGHIKRFERETRGGRALDRRDAVGSSALWTRAKGFIVNDPAKVSPRALLGQVQMLVVGINDIYKGDTPYNKPFLDASYGVLQQYAAHPHADPTQKEIVELWIPIVLRLRYWSLVREKFAAAYAADIKKVYDEELVWPQPPWTTATRADIAGEVEAFKSLPPGKPNADAFGKGPLHRGIWQLRAEFIPSSWI